MSLGLSLLGHSSERRFIRTAISPRRVAAEFAAIAGRHEIFRHFSTITTGEDGAEYVGLLPIEEYVEFQSNDGQLTILAKTSSAGPGYHAALCTLLDEVAKRLKLTWVESEDFFDETGFFSSRDYPALQREMSAFFKGMASMLLKKIQDWEQADYRLAFPIGFVPITPTNTVLTLRGPRDRAFFDKAMQPTDDGMPANVDQYFPWWAEGLNNASTVGLLEALLWMEFPWRAPVDDHERRVCSAITSLIDRLGRQDTENAHLPVGEVTGILASEEPVRPAETGIGYRRRDLLRVLPGHWRIDVPGYFLSEYDDEDRVMRYWFDGRTIHISTYAFEGERVFEPGEKIAANPNDIGFVDGSVAYTFQYHTGNDDDDDYRFLQGEVETASGILIATIVYDDESEKDWATSVFCSIAPSPEENPD